MDAFYADFLLNFESLWIHKVEKFSDKDAKKGSPQQVIFQHDLLRTTPKRAILASKCNYARGLMNPMLNPNVFLVRETCLPFTMAVGVNHLSEAFASCDSGINIAKRIYDFVIGLFELIPLINYLTLKFDYWITTRNFTYTPEYLKRCFLETNTSAGGKKIMQLEIYLPQKEAFIWIQIQQGPQSLRLDSIIGNPIDDAKDEDAKMEFITNAEITVDKLASVLNQLCEDTNEMDSSIGKELLNLRDTPIATFLPQSMAV